MIVLIDNYDSFTYNLYQLLGAYEEEIVVLRNDKVTIQELEEMKPKAIILSPGPGKPEDAGICTQVIQHFYKQIPILGICLGHQAIVSAFGGEIVRAEHIKHGKTSRVKHNGTSIFSYVAQPLTAMRYHSLVAAKHTIPKCFDVLATAMDDGEIMAVRHNYYPLFGLQFHPESIATEEGGKLIRAFLSSVKEEERV
ncbi:aminodeoxychorismate/anthranilate synthase component II [Bacillus pseudomycoides]|uniref:aminodeoxychorismate/anthranilate synthase component II n=1 Tax=Bacillus pseudomycoides TaxID=64104 RepID=UPI000BEBC0E2|nr:aminodeoxychorismate/anthranilate synthase component II [Bacillus pseudomycoides]PEF21853.1 aminodeoxychorismate/anthranilate synthase component II [Bacillus pseudomycoides]PEF76689.1 aminodeoxychorismate/anthranilate synthase component II [Bacillus pseudomycoides]PEI45999.1 aminodeoxychorismate/anthranilate synthase component II [Bacillus pseudomycoides]PEJ39430.1 aminodeoxychorismate/anthranilate synthase component II [Bacillus pseudomycoides]PEL86215.1 aminodeoxychorismate/anthranilate s